MSRIVRMVALAVAAFASGVALRDRVQEVLRPRSPADDDDAGSDTIVGDELADRLLIEYTIEADGWFPEGMLAGTLPYRVFETARYRDGDAFVLAVGSPAGDPLYALISGAPPVGDAPDIEESLDALRTAVTTLESEIESHYILANVTSVVAVAPEARDERERLHDALVALMEGHGDAMEELATSDVDGLLAHLTSGWLFNSPLLRARRAIKELP